MRMRMSFLDTRRAQTWEKRFPIFCIRGLLVDSSIWIHHSDDDGDEREKEERKNFFPSWQQVIRKFLGKNGKEVEKNVLGS